MNYLINIQCNCIEEYFDWGSVDLLGTIQYGNAASFL